jgi:hypothetical protein
MAEWPKTFQGASETLMLKALLRLLELVSKIVFARARLQRLRKKISLDMKTCQGTASSRAVCACKSNNSSLPQACAERSAAHKKMFFFAPSSALP